MGATSCSANVVANGQKNERNETKGKEKQQQKAGKKSNNCQELGHITALVDARQFPRPECGQLLLQLLLPPPCCTLRVLLGHSVSMSCLLCVFFECFVRH